MTTKTRPTVVSMRGEGQHWKHDRRAVRLDRANYKWGNPFRTGPDGPRETVIAKFAARLLDEITNGVKTREDLAAFAGGIIACWCAPLWCHLDIVADGAEAAAGDDRGWTTWMDSLPETDDAPTLATWIADNRPR